MEEGEEVRIENVETNYNTGGRPSCDFCEGPAEIAVRLKATSRYYVIRTAAGEKKTAPTMVFFGIFKEDLLSDRYLRPKSISLATAWPIAWMSLLDGGGSF